MYDDYIALVAHNTKQIETYKLTSEGCYLWNTSNIKLDNYFDKIYVPNCIDHTIDNSTIIVSTFYNKAYILNFNSTNGEVSIINKIENEEKINRFAFSNTDKYFLLIDNDELKAYKYNKNFDYKFEKPYLAYQLTSVEKNGCNSCYEMAIGIDGKLYIFKRNDNKLIILNGIETGNINIETITISDKFSSYDFFPRIPRKPFLNICNANAEFNNSYVCHNQSLKILSEGTAPYEISYTLNGIEKTITTSEQEYTMPDIVGKYKISKIKDANCEFEPTHNNTSEIVQKIKKPTIEYK